MLGHISLHLSGVLFGVFARDTFRAILVDDGLGDLDRHKVPITHSFLHYPSDNFPFASTLELITFQFSVIVIICRLKLLLLLQGILLQLL